MEINGLLGEEMDGRCWEITFYSVFQRFCSHLLILILQGVNKDLDAYSAFASPDTPGARLISDQASSTSTATSSAESSISRRGNGGTPSPTFENTTSCSGSCARLLPSNERPYTSNNRYYSSPLASFLRKKDVERIVICGIATDVCVKATVEDALRCGFQVILVIDAVKGVDEENSKQVLDNFRRNEWVRVVKGIKELKEVLETLCWTYVYLYMKSK